MAGEWLVMCDADSVQAWLLRSVHLREIAGASQLLVEYDERLCDVAQGGQVLFSGGGTAMVCFTDESRALAFRDNVKNEFRRITVDASLTVGDPIPVNGSFGEAVRRAVENVEQHKRQGRAVGEKLDFCHALRCDSCGVEPVVASGILRVAGDVRRLGASCLARHDRRERADWLDRMHGHDGWQTAETSNLSTDSNELAAGGKLAIVIADVNGVGERLRMLDTKDAFQTFSEGLRNTLWEALTRAIAAVFPPPHSGSKLRVEVLYAGGDDLLIACRSDFVLPLIAKLAAGFSRYTTGQTWAHGEPLGISAGIAIVSSKFPFRLAHSLATRLLRNAKRACQAEGWTEGAVDWAVVTEAWADTDAILADRSVESTSSSLHLTGRPYRANDHGPRSLGSFRRACEAVASACPRNKLFDLRASCSARRFALSSRAPSASDIDTARRTLKSDIHDVVRRICRNPEVSLRWSQSCNVLELTEGFWTHETTWRSPVGDLAEGIDLWGLS